METNELNQYPENEPQPKNNKVILAVLAIALLASLGFNAYQFSQNKQANQTVETLNIDLKDTETARELLQEKLDDLNMQFEETRMDLSAKDSILTHRDSEIFEKQKQIQSILNKSDVSEKELKQAQRMINSLNQDIAQFKKEISILKEKNDSLVAVNDTLQFNQTQLTSELAVEKQRADDTEHKMRSTFAVSNYQIQGLKVKKSGKEVETDKAKRIDKLRVSFDLDANQYAESGQKEIYIAIYKPDGSLGRFKDATHGQLETASNGNIDYSDKVSFNYQRGSKQNISFDWEDFDFPRGHYKIDLYQNGLKIGNKSVELK
ncbi:MAG TPA: hypothetical protein VL022_07140 [Moheibacter sp.]|nr:hypothetical protein [Moheibacter sp.]